MSNHLKNQTSPYLLQHAENPVDWYPWCKEAFEKSQREDKPIFLSIGYSTCHWCHVMAHESFENPEIANILNENFISIKVDKEERPDVDSVYMMVCQAFSGNGGWPTSIFMTADKKPFFAGTYFPPDSTHGGIGFKQLLEAIDNAWKTDRNNLKASAEKAVDSLKKPYKGSGLATASLPDKAFKMYEKSFDSKNGGFGGAPKFPAPHNLLFLMTYYQNNHIPKALQMAEKTLTQMYRGGIFDHIGYGFSRYSTDKFYLVPHFEKMLYDNALLIMAYCRAFEITKKPLYKEAATKTSLYLVREMLSPHGGFYSAQDADSDGKEGKYYLLDFDEVISVLGEERGNRFCKHYGITRTGNFEGKNIPNLLGSENNDGECEKWVAEVYEYRKKRNKLSSDDKILTSWNSLTIAAMCDMYRITGEEGYLDCAKRAQQFIETELCAENTLFVSCKDEIRGEKGFVDDYANYIFALLRLYDATLAPQFQDRAKVLCSKAVSDFFDNENGGFYLYGKEHEALILRPKESFDGAMPSGNSLMAYNLVRLYHITEDNSLKELCDRELGYMAEQAAAYPTGHAMFLTALSDYLKMPPKITAVSENADDIKALPIKTPLRSIVKTVPPSSDYPLKDGKTTFYVCENNACRPPVNNLELHSQ